MNVGSSKYPIDIDDILARAKRLGLLGKETRLKMLEKRSQLEEFVVNPCVDTMVDLGKSIQTKALIWHAISSGRCEPVLKYAGKSQLDSDMCFVACQANGENLAYVPDRLLNEDIVKVAISNRGDMLSVVPQQYRTYDICYTAVLHDYSEDALATQNIPENLFVGESGRVLYTAAITHNPVASNYLPCILKLNSTQLVRPCLKSKTLVVSNAYSTMVHKVFDPQDISALSIYYVSDIHLEHQLSLNGALEYDARLLIRKKIRELTQCISEKRAIILFAGDITCYPHLHRIYREEMGKAHRSLDMDWFFVYILGNHELWNGNPVEVGPHRDIETVIRSYRRDLWDVKDKVLENSALIKYTPWNQFPLQCNFREISEQQLLSMPMDELSGLCQQSAMIILGGVGFAGLNTEFNATNGIYRSTITREEEIVRSHRFVAIYKKFLACAADKQVIVLTHMPMSDWTDMEPNPNWVYINGHTHRNTVIRELDGTTVLSDNQVGYKPQAWHLNKFSLCGWYDPFQNWTDGIYKISNGQYIDFNLGRGISSKGCRRPGTLYMLKRSGVYMFFLDGKSLYLLNGGHIRKAEYPLQYYYNHLLNYVEKLEMVFAPYRAILTKISEEVKSFGGSGLIHGGIVDIDYYTHLFLDPFTGLATPYCALSKEEKVTFPDISEMLGQSSGLVWYTSTYFAPPPKDYQTMLKKYEELSKDNRVPALCSLPISEEFSNLDSAATSMQMYKLSAIIRAVQYAFDNKVVRIWNDQVISNTVNKLTLASLAIPDKST